MRPEAGAVSSILWLQGTWIIIPVLINYQRSHTVTKSASVSEKNLKLLRYRLNKKWYTIIKFKCHFLLIQHSMELFISNKHHIMLNYDKEKQEDPRKLILQRFFDLLFQKVTLDCTQRGSWSVYTVIKHKYLSLIE